MENCRSCGKSPDRCSCSWRHPDKYPCKRCGARGVRAVMSPVDDARGFTAHWLCRNSADCESRVALATAGAVKDQ